MKKLIIENHDYRAFLIASLMLIITIAVGFCCTTIYKMFYPPQQYFIVHCYHDEYDNFDEEYDDSFSDECNEYAISSTEGLNSEL